MMKEVGGGNYTVKIIPVSEKGPALIIGGLGEAEAFRMVEEHRDLYDVEIYYKNTMIGKITLDPIEREERRKWSRYLMSLEEMEEKSKDSPSPE
jgi:hypothetical protein